MARLARLTLPGHTHLVLQPGHPESRVFLDAADRASYLAALREAAAHGGTSVHGWALLEHEVRLLLTPTRPGAVSALMQALGRRYVAAFNRRHARSGTLWAGRFRCALVEPGAPRLQALLWLDGAGPPEHTSAGARLGLAAPGLLVQPPEYWAQGNTPFEREAGWRHLLVQGLGEARIAALQQAARGGWVLGSAAYAGQVQGESSRPSQPRPRGRPRRGSPG